MDAHTNMLWSSILLWIIFYRCSLFTHSWVSESPLTSHTHAHTRTHTHIHTRRHARTQAHRHTHKCTHHRKTFQCILKSNHVTLCWEFCQFWGNKKLLAKILITVTTGNGIMTVFFSLIAKPNLICKQQKILEQVGQIILCLSGLRHSSS
jgi:hypothetical protein